MFRTFFAFFRRNDSEEKETLPLLGRKKSSKDLKKKEENQKGNFQDLLRRLKKSNKITSQYIEFLSKYEQGLDEEEPFSFLITERQAYRYASDKITRNYNNLLTLVKKLSLKKEFSLENLDMESKMILSKSFDEFFLLYEKKTALEIRKINEGIISSIETYLLPEEFDEIKLFAGLKSKKNLSNSNQSSIISLQDSNNTLAKKSLKREGKRNSKKLF